MKRILHLRSSGALLGAENVILEIAKNSPRFGYESFIGAVNNFKDPYPEFLYPAEKTGIKTVVFNGKGRTDKKRLSDIKDFIRYNHIDIIHSHGYKEDYYCMRIPRSIPRIATNHLWKKTSVKGYLYSLLDIFFLSFFNISVGVSNEIIDEMRRFGLRRTVKISNGVDCTIYSPNEKSSEFMTKLGIPSEAKVIGMISSITPEKGHTVAIKAFEMLETDINIVLLIVGDGPSKERLKQQIKAAGLSERIIFAGKQSRIPEILSIIDIYILPSFSEGLPMALLEAMAAGKAVVANSVGEVSNVIIDMVNGLLINSGNPAELAKKIEYLLTQPEIRSKMGSAARDRIKKKYSSLKMTRNYCRLYDLLKEDA